MGLLQFTCELYIMSKQTQSHFWQKKTSPNNCMTHSMRQVSTLKAKCFPLLLITKNLIHLLRLLEGRTIPKTGYPMPITFSKPKSQSCTVYCLSLAQQWKPYINSRKAVWADWSTVVSVPTYDLWLRDKYLHWKVEIFLLIDWLAPQPPDKSQPMKETVLLTHESESCQHTNARIHLTGNQ